MKFFREHYLLVLIIIAYPFLIKYVYVQHNQYVDIPMIWRALDKSYLSGDWVLNFNDLFSPRYFYVQYMAFFSRYLSLPIVYFFNYLLTVFFLSSASYFFTLKLYKSKYISLLTTIMILFGQSYTIGGNDLIGRDLDPSRIAFSLVLLGFTLLFYKKNLLTALVFSFSSYLHLLIGFESPVLFYTLFLIFYIQKKQSESLKNIIKSICIYLALSSYGIYTYISSLIAQKNLNIPTDLMTFILTQIRAPFHYTPSTWNISSYFLFALFICLGLSFLFYFRHIIDKNIQLITIGLVSIILLLNVLGYVFSEVVRVYFIIALQFFRLNVVIYWLLGLIIYGGIFSYLLKTRHKNMLLLLGVSLLPFVLARPESLFEPGPTRTIYLLLGVIYSFFGLKRQKSQAFSICILLLIFYFPFRYYHFQFDQLYPVFTPEIESALWAKNNSLKNSIFLVPSDFYMFKLNSQRSTIVDLEDMPFHPGGMVEWYNRLKIIAFLNQESPLGISRQRIIENYARVDKKRLQYIFSVYPFDYIIWEKNVELPYTLVHTNERYNIYQLTNNDKQLIF